MKKEEGCLERKDVHWEVKELSAADETRYEIRGVPNEFEGARSKRGTDKKMLKVVSYHLDAWAKEGSTGRNRSKSVIQIS